MSDKATENIPNVLDGIGIDLPKVEVGDHPVEKGNYLFDTLEINSLKSTLLQLIDQRSPGGIIYGNPRMGKTNAIEYLIRLFDSDYAQEFKPFRFNCQKFHKPNENTFFEFLLRDVGHGLFDKGKANAKRDRLFKYLLNVGESTTRKQIVLFLDDAQRLQEIEYEWLMDIFNELDRYGITLTSLLIGQKELKNVRSTYAEANMLQIVGRFMIHKYQFQGIKDHDSLCYFLAAYDYATEYPSSSGCSYTRYFFPKGFVLGNRLEHFSETLWDYFYKLNLKTSNKKNFEIPMYHMTTIINYVFRKYGTNGQELEWLNFSHFKEAIDYSGYSIYLGIVQ